MKISRTKKYVSDQMLSALLREFEAGTEVSATGLSYKNYDSNELYEILPDAFVVKPPVSRSEAIRLFAKALRKCRHADTMTSDDLIREATFIQHRALAVPQVPFTLWTKFRARDMDRAKSFKLQWRGVKLRSAANLPKWLRRGEYLLNGIGRIYPDRPIRYGHVILTCDDRNEERAVDRMMDALQLMLGLLNMYETWGRYTHWGDRNWTEGKLWLGPNQFVFRGRKFRGDEHIWYNPDYDAEAWALHPPDMTRILKVVPWTKKALAALDAHPLRDALVRAIMPFQDGFASRDSSHRLLRYWSALEQLYVEPDAKSGSNEKVIERSLFGERDPQLSRWKLEHIARLRNDYVHAGRSGDDLHDLCQFLRELLARHINYWIFSSGDLSDHSALLQLVKLPGDKSQLQQLRSLVDRRLGFLEKLG